jgi:amino acid transporter
MATWIINVPAIQVILIIAMAALILSLWGNVFLSSTRMIFASAFDRVLPEKVAAVSRGGVPWVALLLMAIPAIPISALYAYTSWFARFTYDAVLGLIVTYLITSVALIMMPRRAKRVWDQSAVPKSKIAGIPWMAVVAIIYGAFLAFNLVLYLKDKVYGVNDWKSLIFMGCLYVLALVIWAIAKVVRRRQGMALETVAKEIPFE